MSKSAIPPPGLDDFDPFRARLIELNCGGEHMVAMRGLMRVLIFAAVDPKGVLHTFASRVYDDGRMECQTHRPMV